VIVAPTLPRLSDAPITAIDFGDKITDSVIDVGFVILYNKVILGNADLCFLAS
jgi:hypothetical protein